MDAAQETANLQWRSACPISSGLDLLGDKWSLLLIRDLFQHGTRTYSEFSDSPEHISTNILAARLRLLSAAGLIERTSPDRSARNNAYRLTERGQALRPVLEAMALWSQAHLKGVHPGMVDIF